jgi:hypothetical protein
MTDQEILEGNMIIADFMGYYYLASAFYPKITRGNGWFKHAKYHFDWNWLMGVVQKINKTGEYDVAIFRTTCHINDREQVLFETDHETSKSCALIICVWKVIVEFLKNQQKP